MIHRLYLGTIAINLLIKSTELEIKISWSHLLQID